MRRFLCSLLPLLFLILTAAWMQYRAEKEWSSYEAVVRGDTTWYEVVIVHGKKLKDVTLKITGIAFHRIP